MTTTTTTTTKYNNNNPPKNQHPEREREREREKCSKPRNQATNGPRITKQQPKSILPRVFTRSCWKFFYLKRWTSKRWTSPPTCGCSSGGANFHMRVGSHEIRKEEKKKRRKEEKKKKEKRKEKERKGGKGKKRKRNL